MKKLLPKLLLFLLFIFFAYVLFVLYIISGDPKEVAQKCTQFIAPLEEYNKNYGHYPSQEQLSITFLEHSFLLEKCGYRVIEDKNKFIFYVSAGLGVGGYDSSTGKWWYD